MKAHFLVAALVATVLAGCAAVPDKLPPPDLEDHVPLAGLPASDAGRWPDAHWWRAYDDPQLEHLIALALQGSTDLAEARSRVEKAAQAARVTAARAGLKINGNAQVTRQRMSENGLIPPEFLGFTWYNQGDLGISLDYDFDWWGKHRAAVESAIGTARAAQAQASAATLALETAVAKLWFAWLTNQARLDIARAQVADHERQRHIATLRVRAGLEPSDRVHQADAALAGAQQQLTALDAQAAMQRATLAALLGMPQTQLPALHAHPLPAPRTRLPADIGIDLMARRPDIVASRWQVEAALRDTDVARARFLPDISLRAMAGLSSIDLDKLLDAGSRTFALTPAIHLPLFESGMLRARYGLARAGLEAAIAQYDKTLMDAAREVATRALTLHQLQKRMRQQSRQTDAVAALDANARARHGRGLTDARPLLEARGRLLRQRDAMLALQGQALAADIDLIQALGGGYHDAAPPSSPTPRTPPEEQHD